MKNKNVIIDDEDFDLDNSDDLNRFINKYESLVKNEDETSLKNDDIDSLVEEELSRNTSNEVEGPSIEKRRGTGPVMPSITNVMGIVPKQK